MVGKDVSKVIIGVILSKTVTPRLLSVIFKMAAEDVFEKADKYLKFVMNILINNIRNGNDLIFSW